MSERKFTVERLLERADKLRQRCPDDETYLVEFAKLLITNARDDNERRTWEGMLRTMKLFQGWSDDDEREETVERIRATLKAQHPFIRFHVMRAGPRTSRRWEVRWTNGPLEAEIKGIIAPFARKDLSFVYLRKSALV
jgi:hypothetical protein